MNDELLPCPFCPPEKSDPRLINAGVYLHYVKCCSCGCASGLACSSEEQAIANWNRRAERTCRWELVKRGTMYDVYGCSACGYEYAEPVTDGGVLVSIGDASYCPSCGAKVVE